MPKLTLWCAYAQAHAVVCFAVPVLSCAVPCRAVACSSVLCCIVDYNFFSPHSRTGGFLSPPIFMPIPGGGGAAGGTAAEGAAGGAAAGGAAGRLQVLK
jgi:hypothetical protein